MSKNVYHKSLIEDSDNPYDLISIYDDYLKNNITNSFKYNYFNKESTPYDENLVIEIIVNIPNTEKIRYIPSYLFTFKEAWIQYICLLIPLYIAIRQILYFLITLNIFQSYKFYCNVTTNNNSFSKSKLD